MSGETFRKLKLDNKDLDTENLPTVVGADGRSLRIDQRFSNSFCNSKPQ